MPAKKNKVTVVSVRLPETMIESIDKVIPHIDSEHWEGTSTTRGDAIRYLIRAGLESVNKETEALRRDLSRIDKLGSDERK